MCVCLCGIEYAYKPSDVLGLMFTPNEEVNYIYVHTCVPVGRFLCGCCNITRYVLTYIRTYVVVVHVHTYIVVVHVHTYIRTYIVVVHVHTYVVVVHTNSIRPCKINFTFLVSLLVNNFRPKKKKNYFKEMSVSMLGSKPDQNIVIYQVKHVCSA